MSFDNLPRNSASTSVFAFPWDGFVGPTGARTQLANGEYILKLTVVRALGNPNNLAQVEPRRSQRATSSAPGTRGRTTGGRPAQARRPHTFPRGTRLSAPPGRPMPRGPA